jgi:hypothetical protein
MKGGAPGRKGCGLGAKLEDKACLHCMALARSPTTFGADCCAWALGREALTKWRRRRDEQDHPYWLTDPYGLKIVLLKKDC